MHIPQSQTRCETQKAVVFIHGFMGSPVQFADLSNAVYEAGCSCFSILLPGHGAGVHDFVKCDADKWERHVQNEINGIRDTYKNIYLIGHSMGGLLALNASLVRENKIAGVFLLATPLKINKLKLLLFGLRLLTYPKTHEIRTIYSQANSLSNGNILLLPLYMKPIIQFYSLVKKTRRRLAEIFVPVYMIHSENDETTAFQSAKLLYEGLYNTQRISFSIIKSRHAFYLAEERKIIAEKLIDFIR